MILLWINCNGRDLGNFDDEFGSRGVFGAQRKQEETREKVRSREGGKER